jgi:Histidine kinase
LDPLHTIWDKVSMLGNDPTFSEHLNRKLILGNRIAALAGVLVFSLAFLYIDFWPQFITYLGGALFCFLLLLLNAYGKVNFSRVFFMMSIPTFLAVGGMIAPDAIHSEQKMALISSIIIPLVLFGITEKKWMALGLAWTVVCFVVADFVRLSDFITPTDNILLDPKVVEYLGALVSFSIFISTFIYLQRLNLEAEEKLKNLLEQSNKQKSEIEKQKAQLEEVNRILRIKALTAQLNPHFLYNSLNSIQHFLTINDKTSSINYLSKFGRLIRQFIDYSDKGMIPLQDELTLLRFYLELESLRFGSRFNYQLEADEDLLLYSVDVSLLLIQIHVENAILHGLINKEDDDRRLTIQFKKDGEFMLCEVKDNGIGRYASAKLQQKRKEKYTSLGIAISTQRLKLVYVGYKPEELVKITDLYDESGCPIGTCVELRIPLESF